MRKATLFAFLLLLFSAVFAVPAVTNRAHAQFTGTVCIIASGGTSCPSSPPTITGTVGTQLRVSVFVQSSDGINAFQVTLLANHLILKPADADITGTILPGPQTILVKCIGGVLVQGSTCASNDTPDTIDIAVAAAPGTITGTPVTGLLFTAIYNVTGSTGGTTMGYQTGCSTPTSVPPNTCITLANGTPTPDPETALTATFSTGAPPDFSISANPTALTIARGSSAPSTITLTSSGFIGTVSLSTSISPIARHGPTASLSLTSVPLSSGGTGSSVLTVSAGGKASLGTFSVTVTGTSGSLSHSVVVTVTVIK